MKESLVSPEEAYRLAAFRTVRDVYIAVDIAEHSSNKVNMETDYICMLGAIWNAGRVQGIREERLKKAHIN